MKETRIEIRRKCDDGVVDIVNSDNTPIASVTVPSGGNAPYTVTDSIVDIDGLVWNVPATDNLNLSVVDSAGGSVIPTIQNGLEIVVVGAKDIRIDVFFEAGHDVTYKITIDAYNASSIVSMTEIGSSGGFTMLLNGVSTLAPFNLVAGDELQFFRNDDSVDGIIRLMGTI